MDKTLSVSVDQAGGTTAELIAGVTGKKILVTGMCLSVGGAAVTVKSTLQDTSANTVRATLVGNATTPVVYSSQEPVHGLFATAVSDGLELVTGTAAAISGWINYRFV